MRPPLKVLIVEDSPERQKILVNLFKDHAWVMAHTSARAIRLIEAYRFDLIALDYDLAGPGKGDEVAQLIAGSKNAETEILIHSMNDPGVQRIKMSLPNATAVPISKITRDNTTFKRIREELKRGVKIDWAFVFRKRE